MDPYVVLQIGTKAVSLDVYTLYIVCLCPTTYNAMIIAFKMASYGGIHAKIFCLNMNAGDDSFFSKLKPVNTVSQEPKCARFSRVFSVCLLFKSI